ncbi:MAG: sel1 repeat family protein [Alphaproteobacteria bacterium]|nr:sel1 repeat family protein [Alphaproteobacteria bacterium]
MKRLRAAATRGDPDAEYNLGVMYDNRIDDHGNAVGPTDDNGNPIASDRAQAIKWLLRAAEHGQPRAQMRLAELYAAGPEAARNYGRACQWFIVAIARLNGIHRLRAQGGYDQVRSELTTTEVLAAQRRARDWERRRRRKADPAAAGSSAQFH